MYIQSFIHLGSTLLQTAISILTHKCRRPLCTLFDFLDPRFAFRGQCGCSYESLKVDVHFTVFGTQSYGMEPLEPSPLPFASHPPLHPIPPKSPESSLNPSATSADPGSPPLDLPFDGSLGSSAGDAVVRRPPSPSSTGVHLQEQRSQEIEELQAEEVPCLQQLARLGRRSCFRVWRISCSPL